MYRWIWRHLPGPAAARLVQALVLLAAVTALLWFVAFPWVHGLIDAPTFAGG